MFNSRGSVKEHRGLGAGSGGLTAKVKAPLLKGEELKDNWKVWNWNRLHQKRINAPQIPSLGYVRNPRSLITETLCCDDIGDFLGSPNHL